MHQIGLSDVTAGFCWKSVSANSKEIEAGKQKLENCYENGNGKVAEEGGPGGTQTVKSSAHFFLFGQFLPGCILHIKTFQ